MNEKDEFGMGVNIRIILLNGGKIRIRMLIMWWIVENIVSRRRKWLDILVNISKFNMFMIVVLFVLYLCYFF